MLTLDEINYALQDFRLRQVAKKTGLSVATLYAITSGKTTNPGIKTIKLLSDFISNPNFKGGKNDK